MSSSHESGRLRNTPVPVLPLPSRPLVGPPQSLTSFVGRHSDIAAGKAGLARTDVRVLTLTGPGGTGKTRLALQIAAGLGPDVADAVAWVPLAALRDPGAVLPAILRALGAGGVSSHSLLDAAQSATRSRRVLVLLDNCEHLLDMVPDLASLLRACPTLKVLATSREPLRLAGEWIQEVPPLPLPAPGTSTSPEQVGEFDSVQLFVKRAEAVWGRFVLDATTAPVVARICHQLEGMPLAIELAAARLNQLPLETIAERLDQRLPLLSGGPRDAPSRHRTMRDAIAWSYDLLTEREQRLFRLMAVFAGGFTIDAVDAVAREPSFDDVMALVDKSVIRLAPSGFRYLMLETVRELAAERLTASGDEVATRERHAAYFRSLAEEAYPWLTVWETPPSFSTSEPLDWLERLEADHQNLQSALAWFEEQEDRATFLRLATILCPFWDIRGYFAEGRRWMERAMAGLDPADRGTARYAEAAAGLGLIVLRMGDYDRAGTLLDEAHAIWSGSGDDMPRPTLHLFLGGVAEYQGDDERAGSWYERALDGFTAMGNAAGASETLNNLADLAYRRGDPDGAERLATKALTNARDATLPVQMGAALVTIGATAAARGDWGAAVSAHRGALRLSLDASHPLNLTDAIVGLSEVAAATGNPLLAARLLGAVEASIERIGVRRLPHEALHRRAMAGTRSRLDPEVLAAAMAAGRALTRDEAVAESEAVTGDFPRTSPILLTRREGEVLRLLVAGYTDRAIGDELFIGTRTVESHVARIFAKLGVRTRTAAVAVALSTGLVDRTTAGGPDINP